MQICVSFFEVKNKQATWFTQKVERLYWEQWYINLNVAQHVKTHSSKSHHSKLVVDPGGIIIAYLLSTGNFIFTTHALNHPNFLPFHRMCIRGKTYSTGNTRVHSAWCFVSDNQICKWEERSYPAHTKYGGSTVSLWNYYLKVRLVKLLSYLPMKFLHIWLFVCIMYAVIIIRVVIIFQEFRVCGKLIFRLLPYF